MPARAARWGRRTPWRNKDMKSLNGRMMQLLAGTAVLATLLVTVASPASAQQRGPGGPGGHGPGRPPQQQPSCTGGSGTIAGLVKDAEGDAVEGAKVHAGGPTRAEATTAADGSYTLAELCVGDYNVGADKQGTGAGAYDAN